MLIYGQAIQPNAKVLLYCDRFIPYLVHIFPSHSERSTEKKREQLMQKLFFFSCPSSALAEERLRNFAAHKTKRKGTKEPIVRGFFENSLLESAQDTILQINNKRRSWRQSAKCEREDEAKRTEKKELCVCVWCVRQDIDSLCVIGYFYVGKRIFSVKAIKTH